MTSFTNELASVLADEFGVFDKRVVAFVKLSFFKSRPHKHYQDYQSYYCRELDKDLGRGNFELINANTGLFDVLPYSYLGRFTRGIKASAKLIQCFNQAIDQWLPKVDEAEHEDFSKSGGIASRDVHGNNSKFKGNILQAVKVNVKALANLAKITPTNDRETRIKAQSAVVLDTALDNKNLPRRWIAQRYVQHKTGRLYSDGISLQNCCREVRYSALNGLHSFDIDNCHYSILAQSTAAATPNIDHYLANKNKLRCELSIELDLPIDDVKQIMISLIFGARLSPYKVGNAIADICKSAERYAKVLSNKIIKGLYHEVKKSGTELIEKSTVKKGRYSGSIINAMGIICDERASSKQLSHVLQGIEVKALEAVTNISKTDTALLLHDGWVTYSKHDKRVFERAIFNATGLKLSVDLESIECKYFARSKSTTEPNNTDLQGLSPTNACTLIDRYFLIPFPTFFNLPYPTYSIPKLLDSAPSSLNTPPSNLNTNLNWDISRQIKFTP